MPKIRLAIMALIVLLTFCSIVGGQEVTPETTALPLTETYVNEEGSLSLSYPDDWIVDTLNLIGNDRLHIRIESAPSVSTKNINAYGGNFHSGEVLVQISVSNLFDFIWPIPHATLDMSTFEILSAGVATFYLNHNMQYKQVVETSVRGYDAAIVDFYVADDSAEGISLIIDFGGGVLAGLTMATSIGELESWRATAIAIAESIIYSPLDVTTPLILDLVNTDATRDGRATVDFPAGWYTLTNGDNGVIITNQINMLNRNADTFFESGEAQITIIVDSIQNIAGLSESTIMDVLAQITEDIIDDQTLLPLTITSDRQKLIVTVHDHRFDALIWLFHLRPNVVAIVRLTTASGELERWQPVSLAIAESIEYTGAPLSRS